MAYKTQDAKTRRRRADAGSQGRADAAPKEEPISTALAHRLLRVELGYGLLALINDVEGHRLTDQIKALRRQLAQEMGFVMPSVRIQDNMQLGANGYASASRRSRPAAANCSRASCWSWTRAASRSTCRATHTTEPAFGLPATWVDEALREEATFRGYTVVDPGDRADHPPDRSAQGQHGRAAVLRRDQKLLDELAAGAQEAGRGTDPLADLGHRRPARAADPAGRARLDPRPADHPRRHRRGCGHTQNRSTSPSMCARAWRGRSAANCADGGYLPLVTLSPAWEQAFAESHHRPGRGPAAGHGAHRSCRSSSQTCARASTKRAARAKRRCC